MNQHWEMALFIGLLVGLAIGVARNFGDAMEELSGELHHAATALAGLVTAFAAQELSQKNPHLSSGENRGKYFLLLKSGTHFGTIPYLMDIPPCDTW